MTAGCASSMRAASSCAANPPNTTECTAPRRAARKHGDHRLRHHRHVDDDAVALADAQPAQRSGEAGRFVEQFSVGVGALRPGHRRVVDQRRLFGAASVDMTVQRVGAGVQLAVGKPAVERRIGVIEDALRLADPRHRPRGVGPEGHGIGDAGIEQVAISAHTRTVARERFPIVRFHDRRALARGGTPHASGGPPARRAGGEY